MSGAAGLGSAGARAALALLLAGSWLLSAGAPAHAVERWGVDSPDPGQRIGAVTTIKATAEANALQSVEAVQVRLLRDGAQVGPVRGLTHSAGPRSGGTSIWSTSLDPLRSWAADGRAMANGTYTFQVRVSWQGPRGAQQTGWSGHEAVIDADPPATTVSTRTIDTGAHSVEVSWTEVALPDFLRYVVQRASPDGSFADIATLGSSSTTTYLDAAPPPGSYRYRVQVVRDGAGGTERTSTSGERTAEVEEAGQPDPTSPISDESEEPSEPEPSEPDPDPTPGPDPADQADEGGSPDGGASDDGTPRPRRGSSGPVSTSGGGAPRSSGAPSTGTDASAQPPAVSDMETFEEALPYPDAEEETGGEHVPDDDELEWGALDGDPPDGGTLAVHDRELVLEQVLPPLAGGLLLFVVAGHMLRLRGATSR